MIYRIAIILFYLICFNPVSIAQNNLEGLDSLRHTSPEKAFNLGLKLIEKAESDGNSNLVQDVVKLPLFSNDSLFLLFANEKLTKIVSKTEEVYLKAQLMRYYVSVVADFDKTFEYIIDLRKLLEDDHENILYPPVMADVYHIASWIKHIQHDMAKAREYSEKLLAHTREFKMHAMELQTRLGLAEIKQHSGDIEEALNDFNTIEREMVSSKDSTLLNRLYLLMSNLHTDREDHETAMRYAKKAFVIIPESNIQLKSFSTIHLARGFLINNQPDSAIYYGEWAIRIADSLDVKKEQKDLHAFLAEAYKADGNFESALAHLETHLEMEREQVSLSSAANISNLEAALEKERHELEVEKKNIEVIRKNEEVKRKNAEIERNKAVNYALAIGLILAAGMIFIAVRSYLRKKKDAAEIQVQKEIVEEKNNEILDSISYAKRIQTAILPPNRLVKEYLENSFVLYKPKDIVAGDFYWMETKDDMVLFAAADCTGHGVPGAMVSVVCNNGLNRSVREYGLTDPGQILDKTREIVISEFEKSEEDVKDGMDIALCTLKGNVLHYAGAHNPLWIVRKRANDVEEIKADKQPIGKFHQPNPYTTHRIELHAGDSIYVFSDGYADQFGGDRGKKFKSANFKRLILSIQDKSMDQQKQIINDTFESWKGDIEQLDDVCIIGVRI